LKKSREDLDAFISDGNQASFIDVEKAQEEIFAIEDAFKALTKDLNVKVRGIVEEDEINSQLTELERRTVSLSINFSIDSSAANTDRLEEIQRIADDEILTNEQKRAAIDATNSQFDQVAADRNIAFLQAQKTNLEELGELDANYYALKDELTAAQQEKEIDNIDRVIAKEEERKAKFTQGLNLADKVVDAVSNNFKRRKEQELKAAGDNAKKREEIEKKFAKKEQQVALAKAVINTAVAVTAALPNVPLAIATGILGAIEVAAIAGEAFQHGGATDKAGQPIDVAAMITRGEIGTHKNGGSVPGPKLGLIGEAGPEWVASNPMLRDPVTGPIIGWLESERVSRFMDGGITAPNLDGLPGASSPQSQSSNGQVANLKAELRALTFAVSELSDKVEGISAGGIDSDELAEAVFEVIDSNNRSQITSQ